MDAYELVENWNLLNSREKIIRNLYNAFFKFIPARLMI